MADRASVERGFERALFSSRWLMAPMYLGLAVSLALLAVIFLRELVHYLPKAMEMTTEEAILVVLTLIDLTLAANLLLIVIFSGYENFVSKFDIGDADDRPDWMGTVDFSGLKLKLIASIVAISGIHLLKKFMEVGEGAWNPSEGASELFWLVVIHMSFVGSGVLLAAMDWLTSRSK